MGDNSTPGPEFFLTGTSAVETREKAVAVRTELARNRADLERREAKAKSRAEGDEMIEEVLNRLVSQVREDREKAHQAAQQAERQRTDALVDDILKRTREEDPDA